MSKNKDTKKNTDNINQEEIKSVLAEQTESSEVNSAESEPVNGDNTAIPDEPDENIANSSVAEDSGEETGRLDRYRRGRKTGHPKLAGRKEMVFSRNYLFTPP